MASSTATIEVIISGVGDIEPALRANLKRGITNSSD
jgi:hypothetical protein